VTSPDGTRPDNLRRGIAFAVVAMFLLAVMDGISRVMTHRLGLEAPQILWVRFVIFFVFAVVVIGPRRFAPAFRSAMPVVQILRAASLIFEIGIFIVAFRYLSALMLRERVTLGVWAAVLVGMVGVVIAVRPGMQDFTWFHLLPVVGAFSWGFYQTLVRMVGRRDSANTTLAYTVIVGVVLTSCVGPFFWRAPTAVGWGLLFAAGLLGALAHLALIKAYEACSAPRLQPFGYTLLVWAIVVGFVGLGEFPDIWTITGAAVVVSAGIFALLRERRAAARQWAAKAHEAG
jgi:drug/metabolite transporter (DMT)-like permease